MMTPQYTLDNQRAAAALQQLASRWEPETMKNTILYRLRSAKTGYILNYALNKADVEEAFSTFEEALTRIARLEGFDEATVAVLTPVPEEPKLPLGEYMRQWRASDISQASAEQSKDDTPDTPATDQSCIENRKATFDASDDWIDREVKNQAMRFAMEYVSKFIPDCKSDSVPITLANDFYKFLR